MRAVWNGITVAESEKTILIDGNRYFPPGSVDSQVLRRSRMKSLCPWKGLASYYHLEADGHRNGSAAWTYRHPCPWIRKIKNHIAFWNGVDIVADREEPEQS